MNPEDFASARAAMDRFNAGTEIPPVAASDMKDAWEFLSRIPAEQRRAANVGFDVGAVAQGLGVPSRSHEQNLAIGMRFALLDALEERGVLKEFMEDESSRAKVFSAAATIPCNKNDIGEALLQRVLLHYPAETAEKAREEMRQSGYDFEQPKIVDKFLTWMMHGGDPEAE